MVSQSLARNKMPCALATLVTELAVSTVIPIFLAHWWCADQTG